MSKLFVVSAPSGTGKTTLNNRLMSEFSNIEIAVSHTTRKPREGEMNGASYHFVSTATFEQMIEDGELLEWADVFGNFYGTSHKEVERIFSKGHDVLLELDVQGCQAIVRRRPDCVTVFILPPSIEALWHRLEQRGTDALKVRWHRFIAAKHEIDAGYVYEHFIVNDDFERAYSELKSVIIDGKHSSKSHKDGLDLCRKLMMDYQTSPLLQDLKSKFGDNLGTGNG
jgi:guanylate kinase